MYIYIHSPTLLLLYVYTVILIDVHKHALSIDTDTTDPIAPDSVRGIAGANSSKISPLGGTKTSFFDAGGATGVLSLEGSEKLASHDSFSGVNVNTPPTALTTANVGGGGGGGSSGGQIASFALRHSNSGAGLSKLSGNAMLGTSASSSAPPRPALSRSVSHNASVESYRQTIAEIISQIRYAILLHYSLYPDHSISLLLLLLL